MINQCKNCGKNFEVILSLFKRKFCSRKCRNEFGLIKKICAECHKEFISRRSLIAKRKGKFCSKDCESKFKYATVEGICKQCGLKFSFRKSRNRIFCSKGCFKKSQEFKKIKHVCKGCGKYFLIRKCRDSLGLVKFCSRKCWKVFSIGKNASAWKGGATTFQMNIRGSEKYSLWRKQVFERDNFTCQKCGQIGHSIHAHHLKRFSFILNDIKQKFPLLAVDFMAADYPALWDIKNGTTLCKSCHRKEHLKSKQEE